jgi:hypothetical protein
MDTERHLTHFCEPIPCVHADISFIWEKDCRAMSQVERLFHLPESRPAPFYTPAELVALLDSLGSGTLNEHQRETVQVLWDGILSLGMKEEAKI